MICWKKVNILQSESQQYKMESNEKNKVRENELYLKNYKVIEYFLPPQKEINKMLATLNDVNTA